MQSLSFTIKLSLISAFGEVYLIKKIVKKVSVTCEAGL